MKLHLRFQRFSYGMVLKKKFNVGTLRIHYLLHVSGVPLKQLVFNGIQNVHFSLNLFTLIFQATLVSSGYSKYFSSRIFQFYANTSQMRHCFYLQFGRAEFSDRTRVLLTCI